MDGNRKITWADKLRQFCKVNRYVIPFFAVVIAALALVYTLLEPVRGIVGHFWLNSGPNPSTTAMKTPTPIPPTSTPTIPTATLQPHTVQIGAVSYFAPGSNWLKLDNSIPQVGLAIINPNSGPGSAFDPNYGYVVNQAKKMGILVLGYVDSSYAGTQNKSRSLVAVEQDINLYYKWYPDIGGIFIDEVSTDCNDQLSYYQPLFNIVKEHDSNALVVLDPGNTTHECYMAAADIIVNYEGSYSDYIKWSPIGWEFKYKAKQFWNIIYDTNQNEMTKAITQAKTQNVGWVYITDNTGQNPFADLPSYWDTEINATKQP
jgi:hypothetical protein